MASQQSVFSISEQLAYSTVRIECKSADGKRGTGTGFFFTFLQTKDSSVPTIITNKHVVRNAVTGTFHLTVVDGNGLPIVGANSFKSIQLDNFEKRWIPHPDDKIDLAAMPIAPLLDKAENQGISFFFRSLNPEWVATDEFLADLTAVEDILMVGYPNGIWDSYNNSPIFRTGVTATHPAWNYNAKSEFMIDAACFPGSSGSPVLLWNPSSYQEKKSGTVVIGSRIKLLGVLYAGPRHTATGEVKVVEVPSKLDTVAVSLIPNNLGNVIKAREILKFEPIFEAMAKK